LETFSMIHRHLLGCFLVVAVLGACSTTSESTEPRGLTVQTLSGPVEGLEDDGVFSYRGIPYAAPPVGDLRWKPPVAPEPWTEPLRAIDKPAICPQTSFAGLPVPGFNPGEDCLYLNVDTPVQGSNLPVMVWIHGGGFTIGEGLQADGGTSGDRIAREAGAVVVSMNYRLGQLGFLAHSALTKESPDDASGNYGLMDQTAALAWVQDNIASFGGDPDNVTIFGESAGGFSVCSQLASPRSAGLFAKAIMMSGSCERPWASLSAAEAQGDVFAQELGCDSVDDVLACMRAKPFDDLLAALPPGENFGFSPTEDTQGSWGPILDGAFFNEQPSESFASGNFNQVPTIVGFTREEARLFTWLAELSTPPLVVTEENYATLLAYYLGGDADLAARAAAEYPLADYDVPMLALAAVVTDTVFRCPGRMEAAKLAEHVPVYLYQFEFPDGRSQLEAALPFLGADPPEYDLAAFHSAEIPYVFGYDPLLQINFEDFSTTLLEWGPDTADEALWLDTMGYFTRFAATGPPSASDWPSYDPATDQYLAIDSTTRIGTTPAAKCEFWGGEDYLKSQLFAD
jgi:para-nitrobenzyl esterase